MRRGRRHAADTLVRGALVSLAITLVAGLVGAVCTSKAGGAWLESIGVDLRPPRVLHTTFATAWVVLAGMAVVHRYLADRIPSLDDLDRWAYRVGLSCLAGAGIGVLLSVPFGITSGREYVGFHPSLAVPIAAGWIALGGVYARHTVKRFWEGPVYVQLWTVGIALFLWTFAQQYAWLLPSVWADPIVDRRIQWMSCGTIVGAYHLLVYGAALYIGERITGDASAARSTKAFALFWVSLLNVFVNFAHHTYHLPQSHLVKGIAFAVSLTELGLFYFVLQDVLHAPRMPEGTTRLLLRAAKAWTAAVLLGAVLLATPPINALVHGTYVIPGHAMAGAIGVQTMTMLAAVAWMLGERHGRRAVDATAIARWMVALNVATAAMVVWLHVIGLVDGWTRYRGGDAISGFAYRPGWLAASIGPGFAITGGALVVCTVVVVTRWLVLAFAAPEALASPRVALREKRRGRGG